MYIACLLRFDGAYRPDNYFFDISTRVGLPYVLRQDYAKIVFKGRC